MDIQKLSDLRNEDHESFGLKEKQYQERIQDMTLEYNKLKQTIKEDKNEYVNEIKSLVCIFVIMKQKLQHSKEIEILKQNNSTKIKEIKIDNKNKINELMTNIKEYEKENKIIKNQLNLYFYVYIYIIEVRINAVNFKKK